VNIPRLLMEPKIFLYVTGPIKESAIHLKYFTGLKPGFYQKALTVTGKSHTPSAKFLKNMFAVYLSSDCTSISQPMDQGILRSCKFK
jgi:hypothetical protein